MVLALSWFATASLLTLWSLSAWAFLWAVTWAVTNAGVLTSRSTSEFMLLPDWLAVWVPAEFVELITQIASAVTPAAKALLDWAPVLMDGLSLAVGVVWAIGSGLIVVLGLLLNGVVLAGRRRASEMTSHPADSAT